jgi:hypothetical protein
VYDALKDQMKELDNQLSITKEKFGTFCDTKVQNAILECTAVGNATKKTIENSSADFTEWLDQKTKEIEELIVAKSAQQQAQTSSTSSASQHWKQNPECPSKLFPNADIDQLWGTSTRTTSGNPFETNEQSFDTVIPADD